MKKFYTYCVKTIVVTFFTVVVFTGANLLAFSENKSTVLYNNSFSFFSSSAIEKKILELINKERRKRRLDELSWDSRLAGLARSYSGKMARENFFGHRDSKGNSLVDRAREYNIKNWSGLGENLYFSKGIDDPTSSAVTGWLKSPGHRANLLNSSWTTTGIGIAKAKDGRIYITQVFMK